MRLHSLLTGLCALGLLLGAATAQAAAYPAKAVTMVVPFSPGGASDRLARMLDARAATAFGKNFIFEYKEGAGGLIGAMYLAGLKPDGHTFGTVNAPQIYIYSSKPGSAFAVDKLNYLFQISSEPMVLVTHKDSPIKTLEDFTAYCKANPGKLSVGIASGFNSSAGFAQSILQRDAGISFNPVPLKGGSDLTVNLLGKHVQAGIGNLGVVMNEKDKLNFIAVTSEKRDAFIPDVPTFKEKGLNIVEKVRRLFVAPAGLAPEIRAELINRCKSIFDQKAFQDEMIRNGWAPEWVAGDALDDIVRKEFASYKTVAASMKR